MTKEPLKRPTWQLPDGVCRGAWDYLQTPSIATEYDAFHAGHPLLELDRQLILDIALRLEAKRNQSSDRLNVPLSVIDLGCGTGRSLLPLAQRGWQATGVDLSPHMLHELRKKALELGVQDRLSTLEANIVHLDQLPSQSADLILCMYSSFGMIRGKENRHRMLAHVARLLHLEGKFIVHVHNRGAWLRDPNGIPLTVSGWWREKSSADWELGDRVYAYRGLPSMFLHIFSERELRSGLRRAGLTLERMIRLNRRSSGRLEYAHLLPHLRAGGFIAICSAVRPADSKTP